MRMRSRWLSTRIVLATVAASAACRAAPETNPAAPLNESFAVDATARAITPGILRVALTDVPEDSRCPTGVQCVWAGRARVRLRVDSANVQRAIELRTDSATTAVFGHTLMLDSVLPRPVAGQQIPKDRYRVWVHLTRP